MNPVELEQDVLLSISHSIASARDRKQLFLNILSDIKRIIPHDDVGLLVLNDEGTHWQDWSVTDNYFSSDDNRKLLDAGLEGFHAIDSLNARALLGEVIVTREEIRQNYRDLVFWEVVTSSNIAEYLGGPLIAKGRTWGIVWFDSVASGTYHEGNFPAFRKVAQLLALGVENVLAFEKIRRFEQEKSHLLQISSALAKVDSKDVLLRTIFSAIQPVFPFDNAGLFVMDSDGGALSEILDDKTGGDPLQSDLARAGLLGPFPDSNFDGESWTKKSDITIGRLEDEMHLVSGKAREQFEKGIAYGLRHFIGGPLMVNGRKIGLLAFNSKQENFYNNSHLPLFRSISDQVAVALNTILAREELIEKDRDKTILLELSEVFAGARSRDKILEIMVTKVKPVFNFYDTGILLIDGEGRSSDLAVTSPAIDKSRVNQQLREHGYYDGGGLVFEGSALQWLSARIDENDGVYTFDYGGDYSRFSDAALLSAIRGMGYSNGLAGNLRNAGKLLGVFIINYLDGGRAAPAKYFIFKNLVEQLSTAIANIIANEEIARLNEQLKEQNAYLQEEVQREYNFGEIVGQSVVMRNMYQNIELVSRADTTVLITGETGTGKELVARAIHEASGRSAKPLIKLNCAALPPQLVESELFGHERGAFTGAIQRRIGKFELAHRGTIFLDEVGELPLDLQVKLLRVLQECELERLGGNTVIKTDVRVISATNRDLLKEVRDGRFRADLYYRLNVFPVHLPPLRERREDIVPLANHFLGKSAKKLGRQFKGISKSAQAKMENYAWPGNVRELEHVIERSCILTREPMLKDVAIPEGPSLILNPGASPPITTLIENEKRHILKALTLAKGKVSGTGGAAELLGMKPSTLEFRMKKLGIRRAHAYS